MRAHLSAFLRTRFARVAALAATSLVAVTCHSEPTAGCTPSILVFTTQPGNVAAGTGISATVEARNNSGVVQTCFTSNVTISFGANPGGGTLGGTTTRAAVGGVASFTGLTVTKASAAYTLAAASSGLPAATSTGFTVSAGPATALTITTQPTNAQAGGAISAVVVTVIDQFSNTAAGFSGPVGVAITPGTGTAGAVLSGTTSVPAALGVASFSNLSINKTGAGYTLTVSATGLVNATSSAFNITPGATTQLVFTTQPTNVAAGAAIPAVVVTAQDAQGNTTPAFVGAVVVAIGTNPASGTLSGTKTVNAVAGLATFSTLSIDKPGTGYTLSATAASVTGTFTSGAFNVTVGVLSQLVFSQQPTNAVAGVAIGPAMTVTAQDAVGNTVTTFNGNVTLTIGTNPVGGTLFGAATVAAASGVATFSGVSIDKASAGYVLTATAGAVNKQSLAFTISPAQPTQLVFTTQPLQTAAGATIPTVVVTAEDQFNNVATAFANQVTVAISSGTGKAGATLSGTKTVSAVSGVAAFASLSIDSVGANYTLTATATGLVGGFASASFNIVPNTVNHLVFTQGPSNATAGVAISPAIVITAFDASNNLATQFTGGVTLAITPATGTTGAHVSHANFVTVNAIAGVATFSTLSVDSAGTGYKLNASGPATLTSGTFNITPAPASVLVFTTQPGNAVAGANNSLVVTARDSLGNRATSFNSLVTLAVGSGPAGGTILSGGTATAASGIATFSALRNDKVGNYTLSATGGSLSTAVASNSYTITPAAAAALFFTGQPHSAVAGFNNSPAIVVEARDAFANVATGFSGASGTVTLGFANNAGGGTLAGNSLNAVAGVATFANVTIDKTGTGYTLNATGTGAITGGPSSAFNITPDVATKLVFTTTPVTTTAGLTMANVVVTAQDVNSNTATSFTGTVTLAYANNPGGGGLGGTLIKPAVAGVVSFSDLSINVAAANYRLQATSGALTQGQSAFFDIDAAAATQLVFTGQPITPTVAGQPFRPGGAVVSAEDQFGNVDPTFTNTITVSRIAGPSQQLFGDSTVAAVAGVATFTDLTYHTVGTGFTLRASFTGLVSGNSNLFDVKAAPADHLIFSAQPHNAVAGVANSPALTVTALDQFTNTDLAFNGGGSGTMSLAINTGSGSIIAGSSAVISNGVATFSNVQIDLVDSYTLKASSGALVTSPLASSSFTISPAVADHLVFTQQPTTAVAGVAISPNILVVARDAFNNVATGFGGNVTTTISANPGSGTLTGTTIRTALSGVATFDNLKIDKVGTGYRLTAAATLGAPPTSAVSNTFNINPNVADHFTFTTQPNDAVAGVSISPAIVAEARDAFENVATGFTGKGVTLSISSGPGIILSGASATATAGVATFSTVSIDLAGAHTLDAINTVLGDCPTCTAGTSASFNITHAAATKLGFVQQPTTTTAGSTVSPDVTVAAQDPFGNTDPTFTGSVTISISVNPGGSVLSGTLSRPFSLGVATFDDLSLNNIGTGYRLLSVSSPVLTQIQSALFDMN
jgi:hypothetical protein